MKTLKITASVLLTILSVGAFADSKPDGKTPMSTKASIVINQPTMEWGDPTDINEESVEKLKNINYLLIDEPAMNWGQIEDLDIQALESLKNALLIPLPAMSWGEPSDADNFSI
jgi:hypothetical protein